MVELAAWAAAYSGVEDVPKLMASIAVGRGSSDWDAPGADAMTGTETSLEDEVYRTAAYLVHPLDSAQLDQGKLLHDPSSASVMRFVAEMDGNSAFPRSISGTYLREYGLFVHAGASSDSGLLAVLVRHGRVWWDSAFCRRIEIVVDMR